MGQGTSNGTRGVWIGGETKSSFPKTYVNKIDYITMVQQVMHIILVVQQQDLLAVQRQEHNK